MFFSVILCVLGEFLEFIFFFLVVAIFNVQAS